jgi:hypothetical protein
MSKQNRDRGKRAERAVATMLGGKRVGIMGGEDVQHEVYSIEVKSRKSHSVFSWFRQCINNNKDKKIPMLVLHEHGKRHENDLVCLSMKDFIEVTSAKDSD